MVFVVWCSMGRLEVAVVIDGEASDGELLYVKGR